MNWRVFYSWESDLPNKTNRGFIQDALEGALKELRQDKNIEVDPVIDRDTAGVAGAPDIGSTIFEKIDNAGAFVCDVSIINAENPEPRATPNPNVLIELGYALKTVGYKRTILVMNTYYGGPEKLPFDLKQRRVLTYSLGPDDKDKAAVKAELRKKFSEAVKGVIASHVALETEAKQASVFEAAIDAVSHSKPNALAAIGNYMAWFASEIEKLDPNGLPGVADQNLIDAIDKTVPLLKQFSRLSKAVAAIGSIDYATALYKGFESLLPLYEPRKDGQFRRTDFDLVRFIGHEAFTSFIADLMLHKHWTTIGAVLDEKLFRSSPLRGDSLVGFEILSQPVQLLDDVRNKRTGARRVSLHADVLKARHDTNGALVAETSWQAFCEADLLLFLKACSPEVFVPSWWPRSFVLFGSRPPRFLVEATSKRGSENLAKALGCINAVTLADHIEKALPTLGRGLQQMGDLFGIGFQFDAKKIAVF